MDLDARARQQVSSMLHGVTVAGMLPVACMLSVKDPLPLFVEALNDV